VRQIPSGRSGGLSQTAASAAAKIQTARRRPRALP
jgi:hypothetical protein